MKPELKLRAKRRHEPGSESRGQLPCVVAKTQKDSWINHAIKMLTEGAEVKLSQSATATWRLALGGYCLRRVTFVPNSGIMTNFIQ